MKIRASEDYVHLEDHRIPRVIEVQTLEEVAADPQSYVRVEVTDSGPRVAELRFYCVDPDSQGVRQGHLRETEIRAMVEDLVAGFTFRIERFEEGGGLVHAPYADTPAYTEALRFVGRMRAGKTSRDITPQLLERVALVYRDNIDRYPTKAVQHHFQVSQRMAAEYVSRARKRGILPPTKKGKKQA